MGKRSTVAKFPVARLKRIIQSDPDVGKIAQGTPVAVSKSLELFMQSILDEMLIHARESGAKKLTPLYLKRAVHANETFDFLKDIVENVQDDGALVTSSDGKRKKRKVAKEEADESD